ncbi:MAG: hypothetical protein CMH57_12800 [Myxococcales bacterium]|nr:hypothetical protein [Myxococcales bacterium]
MLLVALLIAGCSGEIASSTAGDDVGVGADSGAGDDTGAPEDTGGAPGDTNEASDADDDAASDSASPQDAPGSDSGEVLTFAEDILPIFTEHQCTVCHGGLGGHTLTTLDELLSTGDHAPVVEPCNSADSVLMQKMREDPPFGDPMPQGLPLVPPEQLAIIAAWIDQGAETGATCGGGMDDVGVDVGPDALPEVAPELVEERVLRVSERVTMLSEAVQLPETDAPSRLVPIAQSRVHGYIAVDGDLYGLERDSRLEFLEPGWLAEAPVGELWGATTDADGSLLLSTGIGLLYQADGKLWPSPLTELIDAPIRDMLSEARTHPDRSTSIWFSSDIGLYQLLDGVLYQIQPPEEMASATVGPIAIGPDPGDPLGEALWVAWDDHLYAVAQERDDVLIYPIEVDLGGTILDLGGDRNGNVWARTAAGVFKRKPGALTGTSRWIRWELPGGEEALEMAVHEGGQTWLRSSSALYVTTDGERWTAALDVPVTDVSGMSLGDQGSIWLTRPRRAVHAMASPTVAVIGFRANETLVEMPDLEVFPSFSARVASVELQVDDCANATVPDPPYVLRGGGLLWSDCLTDGEHLLTARITYEGELPEAAVSVPFSWRARDITVTWSGDIEPIYGQYCARSGCHDARQPANYAQWQTLIDSILERLDLPQGDARRMPPNGPEPDEEERRLIRWWREDGFQP